MTSIAVMTFGAKHRAAGRDHAGAVGRLPAWVLVTSCLGGIGLLGVLAISRLNFPLLVGSAAAAVVLQSLE
ncbi:hypothetical protein [Brevibacterium linens]|uniref:hypothetical protein n=1 Tax=Brevibacterium linens TaxID=1703 RepID=UPI000FCB23C6|nr:hypothetical protein [Brevibacterium linens]